MKFGLSFANAGPFANPQAMAHLARSAERHGIESLWSVEHVVIPQGYQSTYPYDPSGRIPAPESVDIPDPFLSLTYMAAVSPEQELARILGRVGPVVAIGRPGEPLPELGAARLYASDDEWRDVIRDLMRRARLVVVRAGATPNLQWEIDEAVRLLPLRHLVIVSFAGERQGNAFEADIARRFGAAPHMEPIPAGPARRAIEGLLATGRLITGRVVWFDEESRPRAVPLRFTIGWTGFLSGWTRPHHAPLNAAFRLVFTRLGLPWIGRRTRTAAFASADAPSSASRRRTRPSRTRARALSRCFAGGASAASRRRRAEVSWTAIRVSTSAVSA